MPADPDLPADAGQDAGLASLPVGVDALIRDAMARYQDDPARADLLFNLAWIQAPACLAVYRVLYKFYNRQRRFDAARDMARRGLAEAARQGGLGEDWRHWRQADLAALEPGLASFIRLTLKALAFLALRGGDADLDGPEQLLAKLAELDPEDSSGRSVVAALLDGLAESA